MGRISEWSRCERLHRLIAQAIEDATCGYEDEVYHYLIFISYDLSEVVCFVNQSDAQQAALIEDYLEWRVETATNYEDAIEIARKYELD